MRDGAAAARLVQQWVHRRGLNDLERFQQELLMREDPEAGFWLRRQWDDPLADRPTLASPAPAAELATPAERFTPEAFAEELHQEPDPDPLPSEAFTEPLSEELRILLATPLEDPFGEPAPRKARGVMPAPSLPVAPSQSLDPFLFENPAEETEAAHGAEGQDSPLGRKGTLSRMKARMRGYLEEAMGVLQRGAPLHSGESPPVREEAGLAGQVPTGPDHDEVAAPSPTTLADLRSWLPDAPGDLPRAS